MSRIVVVWRAISVIIHALYMLKSRMTAYTVVMGFFDDIKRRAATGTDYGYYVVLFGGKAAYIGGITRVLEISGARMEFASGKHTVAVCGEELKVSELEKESVIVNGRITRIEEGG